MQATARMVSVVSFATALQHAYGQALHLSQKFVGPGIGDPGGGKWGAA